jgi:hypothetical protein
MCRNVEKYSKSHCSGKSVRRYFMKHEKVFVDTYEAKKSVCRQISRKVFVDGQKSVCRFLKKKVFVDHLLHST